MSISNLGAVGGSMLYGLLARHTSWSQNYALKGALVFVMLFVLLMFRTHGHPEELLEEDPP
jgi:predicted MFS family arabinose efflux permease